MIGPAPASTANRLLSLLPDEELRALAPRLQRVRLTPGHSLYEPRSILTHLYFPTDGVVSLLCVDSAGASAELALIGSEGVIGLGLLLGGSHSEEIRAVVLAGGHAYRLAAPEAKACFAGGGAFQRLALRFAHGTLVQLSQTAFCNLHHSLEQHLCRRLLLCSDRLGGNQIAMTHELIASMLGVRRQGVTEAAKRLEKRGIITYFRGRITVIDRDALERSACACYRIVKAQSLVPPPAPRTLDDSFRVGRIAA